MSAIPKSLKRTLAAAETIAGFFTAHEIRIALIGAVACAVHNHLRATRDLDLATHTSPFPNLAHIERELKAAGFDAELITPDAQDPLGGVLNVRPKGSKLIQVVNFFNPYGTPGKLGSEAVATALDGAIPGSSLRVVDLPRLIALKLDTGGLQDRADVAALLQVNAPLDLTPIRDVCARHGLAEALGKILAELPDLESRPSGAS